MAGRGRAVLPVPFTKTETPRGGEAVNALFLSDKEVKQKNEYARAEHSELVRPGLHDARQQVVPNAETDSGMKRNRCSGTKYTVVSGAAL